ncbi:putative glycoside hydrolase family 18 protein [Rhypophila decipiens]
MMRGISNLSLAFTAVLWSTTALQASAFADQSDTYEHGNENVALSFRSFADHDDIGSSLGLRADTITTLSEREAAVANTVAKLSTMSDEQLMEGTDEPYAYHQEFHPCPISCDDQLPHNWTVYTDYNRLALCDQPMLFDFNIYIPVTDPEAPTKMRVCNAGDRAASKPGFPVLNKTSTEDSLARRVTPRAIPSSAACPAPNVAPETNVSFLVSEQGPKAENREDVVEVLTQLRHFFMTAECDSTLMFAGAGDAVAGVYIGSGIRREAVSSLVGAMQDSIIAAGASQTAFYQLCSDQRPRKNTLGIAISATGNITAVQNAVKTWNDAGCVGGFNSSSSNAPKITATILESPFDYGLGTNHTTNSTLSIRRDHSRLARRGLCRTRTVEANDGCASLASKCGISRSDFDKFNPDSELCTNPNALQPGMLVCCSEGGMDDLKPKKGADGVCATYHVQRDENCASIAGKHGLKVADIEKFNLLKTFGFTTCANLMADMNICLSEGKRPMPYPNKDALCGPTKPGSDSSYVEDDTDLINLNPCPLNACCNVWGQCGISKDFCVRRPNPFGGPGTSLLKNGCISNCGNAIIKSEVKPLIFGRVAYYETWNFNRDCLHMRVENANGGSRYNIIHWAFAGVNTADWTVSINDTFKQWDKFKQMNEHKVISFGGWGYSTEPETYDVLRQAMSPVNREKFATNVAKFIQDEKLDGVDFDWEYPGAIDIPGTPPGKPEDGTNYLRFLTTMKSKLAKGKSLSIAAPASYWYLKAFPIEKMAAVLDYIVYMTYDLHGQWDAGNQYSIDGCPGGNCLRSHVNLTETKLVLSMITKAKVPSNKIYVGESSYGRSFKMAQAGCKSPSCTFLGDRLNSPAAKGICTDTSGYISNAEIDEIIATGKKVDSWWDEDSDSDMLVYDDTEWVAYMTETTKSRRRGQWQDNHFAGTIDWAVDLQAFGDDDYKGWDESDDLVEEYPPPFPPCAARAFTSLEDIEKDISSIPWWCKDQYMLQVLTDMQSKSLSDYDKLIKNGYDNKFKRYAEALVRSGQKNVDRFMHDKGNDYFSCTVTEAYTCKKACYGMNTVDEDIICRYAEDFKCSFDSGCWNNPECNGNEIETRYKNITMPCSPDFSLRSAPREPATGFNDAVYWKFREGKEEDFWTDLLLDVGIKKEDMRMEPKHKFGGDCMIPPAGKTEDCRHMGHHYNYPVTTSEFKLDDITNPKEIIDKAHGGMQNLKPQMESALSMTHSQYGAIDPFLTDVVDSTSMPVMMMVEAVKQMTTISDTVDKWDEEKRKSIILAFLTAIFIFIPIAGQVGAAFMTTATVARIAAAIGVAGDIAMGIYSAVEDPDNLPLAIIGIVLAPLGLLDAGQMAKAANFRKTMGRPGVQKLGKGVSEPLDTISRIRGDKCLLPKNKKRDMGLEFVPWMATSGVGNETCKAGGN